MKKQTAFDRYAYVALTKAEELLKDKPSEAVLLACDIYFRLNPAIPVNYTGENNRCEP